MPAKKCLSKLFLNRLKRLKNETVEIRADLSTEELEWLEAGKFVELESFPPQKLIQVLNRGIVGSLNLDSDSSSVSVGDTGVYATESFG